MAEDRGFLQAGEACWEGLFSQEEKASFNSSHGLGTQKAWGRRGNAAHGVGESLPPSPSLAPLTELNELSILSVLEESSWERARGQGEEEGRGGRGERQRQRI